MNSNIKKSISNILSEPRTIPQGSIKPLVSDQAKKLVEDVKLKSALPIEWETLFSQNPTLSKEFFKQLQSLEDGDSLEWTKSIDISAAANDIQGSITTALNKDANSLKMKISSDIQYGLVAKDIKAPIGKFGEVSSQGSAQFGVGNTLEFELQNLKQNDFLTQDEILGIQNLKDNPFSFAMNHINTNTTTQSDLIFSNLTAIEFEAELTGSIAGEIQGSTPNSSKNSFVLAAQAELGGNINSRARIEWDDQKAPFLVYQEKIELDLKSQVSAEIQAFKSLGLNLDKNIGYNASALLKTENRLQLPKDFDSKTISKESLVNEIKTSANSFTQTQTLQLNFEQPIQDEKNNLKLQGQEILYVKTMNLEEQLKAPSQNTAIGFTDIVNAFTGSSQPDKVIHYTKTQEGKSANLKVLGQGMSIGQSNTFIDVQ